jgi:hypothetical protein
MTITLHWWLAPLALVLLAAWFFFTAKPSSDYDFVTPLIGAGVALALIAGAVLFTLGRWTA